jgi:hypothetical protein
MEELRRRRILLGRPASEGAALLETGREQMESSVTLQPALAVMGRVAARVLLRPTGIREHGRFVRRRRNG